MLPFNPILSAIEFQILTRTREEKQRAVSLSLDIQKSQQTVLLFDKYWLWEGQEFPYQLKNRPNTFYLWTPEEKQFLPISREDPATGGLVKLVPTPQGPPNFQINGIQMLPQKKVSPFLDAQAKVKRLHPRGKKVLDTCGGLGYFAHFCLEEGAKQIVSFEINEAVLWIRERNPWSPALGNAKLTLSKADILEQIKYCETKEFDCILHDPPRFSIAGDLYSLDFYQQLHRVLRPQGTLFHYTGNPFQLSHGRSFIQEIEKRLKKAGFRTEKGADGLFGEKI